MPITRTPMVDDDGSGTTGTIINNAWKQEFYNQIDALAGAAIVPWTPADASGAGLVFVPGSANYIQIGKLVTVTLHMTFPATANGAMANIGGLPVVAAASSGFYTAYGVARVFHISTGTKAIVVLNATTGAQMTNAQLSGQLIILAGLYHTS